MAVVLMFGDALVLVALGLMIALLGALLWGSR